MTLPYGEPRAHVERNFARDTTDIYLAIRGGDSNLYVLRGDGTTQTIDPAEQLTYDPGRQPTLRLPESVARSLLDALAAHFGGTSETQTLRKDYLHERGRVDKMIEHLIARGTP